MNKKGFTLVELLAVIVILVLIVSISIVFYNNYKKSSTNMLTKAEIAMLMDAGADYYKEFEKTKNYIYYDDNKGNKISCVRIQSLIDAGYYRTNVKFLKEGLSYDKTVVKITENYQGVINYELIEDYTKDLSVCTGYNYSSNISNQSLVAGNNKNLDVSVSGNIVKNNNLKNGYDLTLKIDADVFKQESITTPVYVLFVLDESVSMDDESKYRGSKYDNAVSAVQKLSSNLINNNKDTYAALIGFSDEIYLRRKFENTVFSLNDFTKRLGDETRILGALEYSYNYIKKQKIPNNALKYIVFLTDGEATDDCPGRTIDYGNGPDYYSEKNGCAGLVKKIRDELKTNVFFNFYEYSGRFELLEYSLAFKQMSSIDTTGKLCPKSDYTDSKGRKHCFFNSDRSSINTLFENIGNCITNSYMTLSGGDINLKFNDVIKQSNGSLSDIIEFKYGKKSTIEKKYTVILDESKLSQKYGCSLSTCDVIPLLDENKSFVRLLDNNNQEQGRIFLKTPNINLKKNEVVYVN